MFHSIIVEREVWQRGTQITMWKFSEGKWWWKQLKPVKATNQKPTMTR
jgi:hypothetical protein